MAGIWEYAVQAGVMRLHFFGLKLSPALYDLAPIIYSRDIAVALDSYHPKLREKRRGRRWPRGKEEKQEAFQSFFIRLDRLGLKYRTAIDGIILVIIQWEMEIKRDLGEF